MTVKMHVWNRFPWFLKQHSNEYSKLCTVFWKNMSCLRIGTVILYSVLQLNVFLGNSWEDPRKWCRWTWSFQNFILISWNPETLSMWPVQQEVSQKKFHQCAYGKGFVLNHLFQNHHSTCSRVKKYKIIVEKKNIKIFEGIWRSLEEFRKNLGIFLYISYLSGVETKIFPIKF